MRCEGQVVYVHAIDLAGRGVGSEHALIITGIEDDHAIRRKKSARQPGDLILEVQDLSLPWTGHARGWRLKGISFQLRRGEILGIAGLMGAGRTELLECLFGSSPEPPRGRIVLEGPAEALRQNSDIKEFYLGLNEAGARKSYRDVKHYKRRKRWLS